MVDIEELISSSLPFWETVADFSGIAAGVAAVAAILVDVLPWIKSDRLRAGLKWSLAFVLIAGVFGQITATRRVAGITHEITAFLNDRAETANKLAGEANERAAEANKNAGQANERAAEANKNAGQANERAALAQKEAAQTALKAEELKAENIKLTAELKRLGIQVGDREINDEERSKLKQALNGTRYSITVVMIDDREARQFALAIIDALQKNNARVRTEKIASTSETGVIVCAESKREVNLVRAFRAASIIANLSAAKGANRPDVCDRVITAQPNSSGFLGGMVDGFFGPPGGGPSTEARGTVVLVGQKRRLVPR